MRGNNAAYAWLHLRVYHIWGVGRVAHKEGDALRFTPPTGESMASHNRLSTDHAVELRRKAGAWLKQRRLDAELTQLDITKAMSWGYTSRVSQIERGENRIPPEDMSAYAKLLKLDLGDFTRTLLKFYDPDIYEALFGRGAKHAGTGSTAGSKVPRS
jgi:hypothetical protein